MKFRYFWRGGCWHLQTPPCTSSDWDTVFLPLPGRYATCRWQWPLWFVALWVTIKDHFTLPYDHNPRETKEFHL